MSEFKTIRVDMRTGMELGIMGCFACGSEKVGPLRCTPPITAVEWWNCWASKSVKLRKEVEGLKQQLAERKNCANCRHISVAYICETPHCTLGEIKEEQCQDGDYDHWQPARGKG
jgi:hypothetical protein